MIFIFSFPLVLVVVIDIYIYGGGREEGRKGGSCNSCLCRNKMYCTLAALMCKVTQFN